jgi:spermidine synthase
VNGSDSESSSIRLHRAPLFLLYLNVMIIASCGLVYELLAGTLASYVLGDSVTQFSLVIGVYLFALGVGAWLSGYVTRSPARVFIEVELAVALVGGFSAPVLFLAFGHVNGFYLILFGVVLAIGTLVGLELPLLMRILKEHVEFSDLVSRVLAFDYIGALAASLLFPLVMVPYLGLVRTSFVVGLVNALIGLWGINLLRPLISTRVGGLRIRALIVAGLLIAGIARADVFTSLAEEQQFGDPIVFARTSAYQRIVITQGTHDFHLFLNGNLQFHSADEYRYHEALVHPASAAAGSLKNVLVLGGGDGLALREVFRYDSVEKVTLVDIDPAMTELGRSLPMLSALNQSAFDDPRLTLVHEDAFIWLQNTDQSFDMVIIDFPDPSSFAVSKLYTTTFYRRLAKRLSEGAIVAVQCTSPLSAPKSYWCVVKTLEACGYQVLPYRASVPSFGEWGFVLASQQAMDVPQQLRLAPQMAARLRFLNDTTLRGLFDLPADMSPLEVESNQWNNQILVRYYETEWARWK